MLFQWESLILFSREENSMKNLYKTFVFIVVLSIFILKSTSASALTDFSILHSFAGGNNDGSDPRSSLILCGNSLYGMTPYGGNSGDGTLFSIQTNQGDFTLLHSFDNGSIEGFRPYGGLILNGDIIYGMTNMNLPSGGTIFAIHSNHSDFTILHSFSGGDNDGYYPWGDLISYGNTLYGMTQSGGNGGGGTIFSIQTDHSNFLLLHNFAGGNNDGLAPWGSLTLDGGTLYGMTPSGGSSNYGVLFSIQTDHSNFTILHSFSGGINDGKSPYGSLILNNGTIYGMTSTGGLHDHGTIFSIRTDHSDFVILHSFAGGDNDGYSPWGSLTLDGRTLYGMTLYGGPSNHGTIFSIRTNHSGFTLLHSFSNQSNNGSCPHGNLILKDGTLYGMTEDGGSYNRGTIFSLRLPTSGSSPWITDFNGNGISEIAIFRESSGLWAIRDLTRIYFGAPGDNPEPGDYDGDGTTDIGIYRPASGLWALRGISRIYFGSSSDYPIPADYDGDGISDTAIFRPSSGLWAVRGITRTYFGESSDEPIPGYYGVQGMASIAIYRPSSGLWAIKGITRRYFGSANDTPIPGDFAGDGTWRPGIYRSSSGLWALNGVTRAYFGGGSDRAVPGEYSGDGTDYIAIFRPSSGLWAVRGITRVYYGSTNDIPATR